MEIYLGPALMNSSLELDSYRQTNLFAASANSLARWFIKSG